ncbi:MAG: nucleotidyltransferase family protein [Chloroflexota bacterium]
MISAIILAAGQSRRMGQPKMLLPWEELTVIEHVVTTFLNAGVEDIVVITGSAREQVEDVIAAYPVRTIYNQDFANGEMLSSLQCGFRAMVDQSRAALIGLGDQPQVQEQVVRRVCEAYQENKSQLVVPSFQMRRGHPWLVSRSLWNELLEMNPPESPRDFLNRHTSEIHYVEVDTPSILADLDTPDDYQKSRP